MKSLLSILLCLTACIVSCGNSGKQNQATTIPFKYNNEFLKLIIFSGTLNDSIPMYIMFDTGSSKKEIILSDSLAELLDTTVCLQIGTYKDSLPVFVLDRSNFKRFVFNAILGWQFFEDKIIEISYQDKYIRELDTIPDSSDFFSIKMEMLQNNMFAVPIKVYVQGECIEDNLLIDTGNNGYISLGKYFVDKYKIDLSNAQRLFSISPGGITNYSISVDSVVLGKFTLPNVSVNFITSGNPRARMIGNKILEHFTVILDLRNFYLYLKPNE